MEDVNNIVLRGKPLCHHQGIVVTTVFCNHDLDRIRLRVNESKGFLQSVGQAKSLVIRWKNYGKEGISSDICGYYKRWRVKSLVRK
jgi:hypothetical protein